MNIHLFDISNFLFSSFNLEYWFMRSVNSPPLSIVHVEAVELKKNNIKQERFFSRENENLHNFIVNIDHQPTIFIVPDNFHKRNKFTSIIISDKRMLITLISIYFLHLAPKLSLSIVMMFFFLSQHIHIKFIRLNFFLCFFIAAPLKVLKAFSFFFIIHTTLTFFQRPHFSSVGDENDKECNIKMKIMWLFWCWCLSCVRCVKYKVKEMSAD
jgi:hypothetical protein